MLIEFEGDALWLEAERLPESLAGGIRCLDVEHDVDVSELLENATLRELTRFVCAPIALRRLFHFRAPLLAAHFW